MQLKYCDINVTFSKYTLRYTYSFRIRHSPACDCGHIEQQVDFFPTGSVGRDVFNLFPLIVKVLAGPLWMSGADLCDRPIFCISPGGVHRIADLWCHWSWRRSTRPTKCMRHSVTLSLQPSGATSPQDFLFGKSIVKCDSKYSLQVLLVAVAECLCCFFLQVIAQV